MSFIALQCCQCSTMQVKQRKKSSNKWVCVVCNERQSMRHVFAQGSMARDVRKFVQTFNMSRLYADQKRGTEETVVLDEETEFEETELVDRKGKKKRTDWSEYVDYEPEIGDEVEDVNEPKIVTELPKALFRKPKFSTYSPKFGNENGAGFKPVFSKRKSINTSNSQDKEPSKYLPTTVSKAPKWSDRTFEEKEPTTCNWASKSKTYSAQANENNRTLSTVPSLLHSTSAKVLSKWSNYMLENKSEELCEKEAPFSFCQDGKAKGVSKWDKYVTTEEDYDTPQPKCLREVSNGARKQLDDGIFDFSLIDERVEEDVHPDFE